MAQIEARCTQCGSKDFGGESDNNNSYTYDVSPEETNHGSGNAYGTETFVCPVCSGSCDRFDDCEFENPCEQCATETIHNRCGRSVPTANN